MRRHAGKVVGVGCGGGVLTNADALRTHTGHSSGKETCRRRKSSLGLSALLR